MSESNGLSAPRHPFHLVSRVKVGVLLALLLAPAATALARPDGGSSTVDARATGESLPAAVEVDPSLSIEDRVRCQRRIEEVYWRHRIWPAANPGPKPTLDRMLTEKQLRRRVTTYLLKSAALEVFWSRPLSGEQLQAEMNRMARESREPELLRELHVALDDDPHLIAECLARPALADRLTRNWYARDERVHGALRKQAEAALAAGPNEATRMPNLGGAYGETVWRLASDEPEAAEPEPERVEHPVVDLSAGEWRERIERLAALFGIERASDGAVAIPALLERIPVGRLSRLVERNDRFVVTSVLSKDSSQLRTATVTWSKRSFGAWWADEGRPGVESTRRIDPVSPPSGGYEQRSPLDGGCTADTWTGPFFPAGTDSHTAVWTGTEMIVWGGSADGGDLNTGGRYDPATDSWTATSTEEAAEVPTGRSRHTAVWTGAEMIVWGGWNFDGITTTGARYDLATHSWTATSTGDGVPISRLGQTAVWTGTEMIVWGGWHQFEIDEALDTGGRYDPTRDTWTPTSTGAVPLLERTRHTAVWTGTEMIVWGGVRIVGQLGFTWKALDTGGRYDPASDSWTATAAGFGVPFARYNHAAVWNGTEMIVWGGRLDAGAGGARLNTGGRYNPVTDSWTATSTGSGVPDARYLHTAVWSGTEMIVWGGERGLGYVNTGGRYDPATDRWTATSTGAEVPSGRYEHGVVWTGVEMIVWGGSLSSSGPYLNTGGRYDPATDSWLATSTGDGVPPTRNAHTAVWTGTEMIVWGGREELFGRFPNEPGLYCACEGSTVGTWYPDADGDGYGVDSTGIPACSQPPGYLAVGGDCDDRYASCTTDCTDADSDGVPACAPDCDETNPYCTLDCTDDDADTYCVTHDCDDANPLTHPGADEVNDGEDNHCLYDHGYGIVDEITGVCGFHNPANLDEFSWPAQAGATSYEVARSTDRSFSVDCLVTPTTLTHWVDTDPVPHGTCYYYLVRSTQTNLGSWGPNSAGEERTPACP